jgi:hypothetical protein
MLAVMFEPKYLAVALGVSMALTGPVPFLRHVNSQFLIIGSETDIYRSARFMVTEATCRLLAASRIKATL